MFDMEVPLIKNWFSRLIIAKCRSKVLQNAPRVSRSILQFFRPSLSYHLSLKSFVLSIFEWSLKTGFTVGAIMQCVKTNLHL